MVNLQPGNVSILILTVGSTCFKKRLRDALTTQQVTRYSNHVTNN